MVLVGKGEKVGGNCTVVGLFEAWEREWTGNEFARGGIGRRRRLMRVEGTAVVLGWSKLISVRVRVLNRFLSRIKSIGALPAGR